MTVPLTAQHQILVADANGNSYGTNPPTVQDFTDMVKPAFATGDGGTVTQTGNKSAGVTINKRCGQITMAGSALAAGAEVSFVVTNNTVAATDVPVVCVQSVGTAGAYLVSVGAVSAGSFAITVSNASAGSLSQAIVLNFAVIKAVNN